jgi:vacuolar-type H+-ATPase subunit F/Vma7
LALIEGHGYDFNDTMYYVKEKGKGFEGMECVDNTEKVKKMLKQYEHEKIINLIVIKQREEPPAGLNMDDLEETVADDDQFIVVDSDGVKHISDGVKHISDDEPAMYPVAID